MLFFRSLVRQIDTRRRSLAPLARRKAIGAPMWAVCGSACNEVPTRDSPIRNTSSNFVLASTGDALNCIDERYQMASHLGNVSGGESRS